MLLGTKEQLLGQDRRIILGIEHLLQNQDWVSLLHVQYICQTLPGLSQPDFGIALQAAFGQQPGIILVNGIRILQVHIAVVKYLMGHIHHGKAGRRITAVIGYVNDRHHAGGPGLSTCWCFWVAGWNPMAVTTLSMGLLQKSTMGFPTFSSPLLLISWLESTMLPFP